MISKTHQRIQTFIKKNIEELCPSTAIDEFAEILNECFDQTKQDQSKREKVNVIMSNLTLDDDGSSDKLVEGDLHKYIERLVDFVYGPSDDPLEKNNLKQRSSSGSSDEEDIKGHNKPQNKQKRGRSRSKEKKNKKNQKNQKNPLSQLQKALGKDINIQSLLQQLTNNNNRKQQQQQYNKNVVFLQNVPREMRSYSEIESLLQGRGELTKIQLAGRVPSVQFKNHADAQALIDKFIVHKGIKIEFTAELNKHSDGHGDKFSKDKEAQKTAQPAAPVSTTASQQQQQHQQPSQKQEQKIEEEVDQKKSKEEQELHEQIEQLKGQAKSLIVDKIRLALLLGKRKDQYSPQLSQEITELKGILQKKKEEIEKLNSVELLRAEVKWLNENYDHTLIIKIPELLFRDKNIMKLLHQEFDKYGTIKQLALKLQIKAAYLSYQNFESAEKAYYSTTEQSNFQVEFLNQGIKKVLIAQS